MKKNILAILLILLSLMLISCSHEIVSTSDRTFALDTLIEIKIYHYDNEPVKDTLLTDAFSLIRDLENTLSVHISDSDLYNIKQNAGISAVMVEDITYDIIEDSLTFSALTDGLFDITSGPLIDLWAIDPPEGHYPSEEELAKVLPLIDFQKIKFLKNHQIMLEDEHMIINLGAIAKGSIADEVKSFLINNDVTSALINLGGNVLLIGDKPDGSQFSIGIQDPNDLRGAYLMSVNLSDVAVVSSGDYERFFEYKGKTYHHILNPKTGFPAETKIKQVSIIAPNSQLADGLSTSVLLLGLEQGIELVNSLDDVEAIFITKDDKIFMTDGIKDHVTLSDEQLKDYTIVEKATTLYSSTN